MYLIHVYPILKGVAPPTLTYFSREKYPRGACIQVLIKNKLVHAMVHRSESAKVAKSRLRNASHETSAIKKQVPSFPMHIHLLDALEVAAARALVPVGTLLYLYIPQPVLQRNISTKPLRIRTGSSFTPFAFQAPPEEQLSYLHTLARETLAQESSLLIVVPQQQEAAALYIFFESRLGAKVCTLHGGLSEKARALTWSTMADTKAPAIIITTPFHMGVPKKDIARIVLYHESSSHYEYQERPHTDTRQVAEDYARAGNRQLYMVDALLSVRVHHDIQEGRVEILPSHTEVLRRATTLTLVSLKDEPRGTRISQRTLRHVKEVHAQHEDVFILSGRRGISGTIICGDCSTPILCARCEMPLALFGPSSDIRAPRFYCRHCGYTRDSREACSVCTSWNLKALGIGSEGVEHIIRKCVPREYVVRIDSDTAPTNKKALSLIAKTPSPRVIVGTERVLPFLESTDHIILVGFDALLSVPDYRAAEKSFHLLIAARSNAKKSCTLETRLPEHPIIKSAAEGDLRKFIALELAQRKALAFPPFGTLIEITCVGPKHTVQTHVAKLLGHIKEWEPTVMPHAERGKRGTRVILHLPHNGWPNTKLSHILTVLPPLFRVYVR